MPSTSSSLTADDNEGSIAWAEAFVAGFRSPDTRRAYRRDLTCWFAFCTEHDLPVSRDVRRTQVEAYLHQLEQHRPSLANGTLR